jgi:hypothetical protein
MDRDGNAVSSSVQAYYQQLMSASRPFSSQREYPISVCARFQDGFNPRLLTGFCRLFPQHSVVQPLNAAHQTKALQAMLKAAQQAKDDFMMVTRVAHEAVGLSQAFLTNATSGGVRPAGVFLSQAETMLNRYSGGSGHSTDGSATSVSGGGRGKQFFACHGCGGPHPWSEFCEGKHIVICANQDNPGVRKNAQRNIDRIKKANQNKHFKQNAKRKNLGTANFSNFDEDGHQ